MSHTHPSLRFTHAKTLRDEPVDLLSKVVIDKGPPRASPWMYLGGSTDVILVTICVVVILLSLAKMQGLSLHITVYPRGLPSSQNVSSATADVRGPSSEAGEVSLEAPLDTTLVAQLSPTSAAPSNRTAIQVTQLAAVADFEEVSELPVAPITDSTTIPLENVSRATADVPGPSSEAGEVSLEAPLDTTLVEQLSPTSTAPSNRTASPVTQLAAGMEHGRPARGGYASAHLLILPCAISSLFQTVFDCSTLIAMGLGLNC
ncbi:hypothetical protein CYMTET_25577 [Cymbomonas tetramitiformis]|uniref:Uncharacterized protein n=1 Tax=Cymbomonas tetramitiformis TaxID=36881 RepID=A0AAE0FTK4_9CHLO|nr:hypothetical protein CYMTET_25577 [Cymbomonas tetramitiformis]